jgi:murein DD-endopeptidase MepM/ murein hydrolase activator NlpD
LVPREARAFGLALVLFLSSVFIGRQMAQNPLSIPPVTSQAPSSTDVVPSPTATATSTPTPTHTPTPPPTPTVQETGTVLLGEDNTTLYRLPESCLTHPLRLVVKGNEIYALDSGQLKLITLDAEPRCRPVEPPDNVVVQEVADIALSGDRASLLVLDRAGNVFRFFPSSGGWKVERAADAPEASSRQYLASLCGYGDSFYLLDINVGQIWRQTGERGAVMPTDLDLRESVDLAVGEAIYVLAQEGYRGPLQLHRLVGEPLRSDTGFVPPSHMEDPSLLFLGQGPDPFLYVVVRDHRRLRLLDATTGDLVREYVFADEQIGMDAIFAQGQKLYVAAKNGIYVYPREPAEPVKWGTLPATDRDLETLPPHDPVVLELLPSLALPLEGAILPDLSFRLPGAPRSYRYGVHEGTDFYSAAGQPVTITTPVLSVAEGVVVRADTDYHPPDLSEMEAMLARAAELSHTPEETLDALRGRQIWIDHGGGLVSRYCHLSAVAQDLHVGDQVEQGQTIGYVGNSGTPASYYDPGSEIHLHLEIRIGHGYLGQYLRPIEVKRWLHQVFEGEGVEKVSHCVITGTPARS